MKRFGTIAIVGVGMIGGSIGLAVKKRRLAREVIGVFRRRSSLNKAIARRAADWGTLDVARGVSRADLVIIAADVGIIPALAKKASVHMRRGSVLTDVGSVKAGIVAALEKTLPRGVVFVGAHPMAGSEKTGVDHADADLFEGAVSIVTRTRRTDKRALREIVRFWRSLGARVVVMDPNLHDKRVSMVSHLPHVAALGLCLAQDEKDLAYAAGGFKDATRIASSDPEMWADILKANRAHVLVALDKLIAELGAVRRDLSRRDFRRVLLKIERAKAIRDGA